MTPSEPPVDPAKPEAEPPERATPDWVTPGQVTRETLPPGAAASPEPPKNAAPRRDPLPPRRSALAVLSALGFLLLAGGMAYLWLQIQQFPQPQAIDPARLAALENQVRALQLRLSQASPPPTAPAPDLRPLEQRLSALEQRPTVAPAPPPADNTAALEDKLSGLEKRLAQSEAEAHQASERAARAQRLQAAAAALEAGQKLGRLASAPASLARFADVTPPTMASLRLAFPAAAHAAAIASRPANADQPMLDRMWQRVASLVTLREGDKVLIGPPAATVLAASQERLDVGDLAGAVKALDGLDAAAAAAMADWRGQAQSLLDARAALAAMANG